jgi:hypothetical protein
MNLPLVLNVIISLVFIYLVLSLLASELQELLTTVLQWRAKHLKDSIANLLAGGAETPEKSRVGALVDDIYDDPLVRNINQEARGGLATGFRAITRWLFPGNRKGAFGGNRSTGPSYIDAGTFSSAFMERLGISTLSDQLIDIRLNEFAKRMVGDSVIDANGVTLRDPSLRSGIWEIADRYNLDLTTDPYFLHLSEDFQAALADYRDSRADLLTSIDRLAECLDCYVNAYAEPRPDLMTAYLGRVKAYKLSLFGQHNDRAILSGGLNPTVADVASLVNRSSNTYQEISSRYGSVQNDAEAITQQVKDRANQIARLERQQEPGDLGEDEYQTCLDTALSELSPEQYRTYRDYQAYRRAEGAIDKLPASVRDSLAILARRAQNRTRQTESAIQHFQEEVGLWFDQSMSRASGVYKRNAKGVAIMIGLTIAIFTNSDTFLILNRITSDENLRKVVTDRATQIAPAPSLRPNEMRKELEALKNDTDAVLSDIPLPVTWNPSNLSRQLDCPYVTPPEQGQQPYSLLTRDQWNYLYKACLNPQQNLAKNAQLEQDLKTMPLTFQVLQMINGRPLAFFRMFFGWLVSGIAIAMGAPFWFDLMGKLVNVRNAGSKPPSSADKPPAS